LKTRELVDAINATKQCPKSACPSTEAFKTLFEKNDNIIAVLLSSKLSGTFQSAASAEREIREKFPKKNIFLLDSFSACTGLDFLVLKVAEYIEAGHDFDTVVKMITDFRASHRVRFLLYDLGNLIKNGRLNKIVGKILGTAGVKLVCGDDGNGEIKKYGMALGVRRGLAHLADLIGTDIKRDGKPNRKILISHVHNHPDAQFLADTLKLKYNLTDISISPMRGTSCLYAADKGIVAAY
jgi:DegV family protein with EDD domain